MRISDEIDALERDGPGLGRLPRLDAPARLLARAAVRLHDRDRGRDHRLVPRGGGPDRAGLGRRLPAAVLDVPDAAGLRLLADQGHGDGDVRRARRHLLRLPRRATGRSASAARPPSRWWPTSSASTSSACSAPRSSGAPTRGARSADEAAARARRLLAVAALVAAVARRWRVAARRRAAAATWSRAQFTDAGQLVKGDLVAGRRAQGRQGHGDRAGRRTAWPRSR